MKWTQSLWFTAVLIRGVTNSHPPRTTSSVRTAHRGVRVAEHLSPTGPLHATVQQCTTLPPPWQSPVAWSQQGWRSLQTSTDYQYKGWKSLQTSSIQIISAKVEEQGWRANIGTPGLPGPFCHKKPLLESTGGCRDGDRLVRYRCQHCERVLPVNALLKEQS